MSNVSNKVFSHTHYGVSTVAAVLYAIAWLLGNQVRAEVGVNTVVLPAVIVTAQRPITTVATLEPVVVVGYRSQIQAHIAMLAPVIVSASRDASSVNAPTMKPAVLTSSLPVVSASNVASTPRSKGLVAKVSNWVLGALLK